MVRRRADFEIDGEKMKAARFLISASAECATCGTKLVISQPGAPVDKQNALAHQYVADAKIRTWIIDHAKTCAPAQEVG